MTRVCAPWAHIKECSLFFHLHHVFIVVQIAMTQCSVFEYFRSLIWLPPCAKSEDVINILLSFRVNDGPTRQKRQEAYNDAQKACSTLSLSVPMATLCEFVTGAREMAARDLDLSGPFWEGDGSVLKCFTSLFAVVPIYPDGTSVVFCHFAWLSPTT